MKLAYFVNQYPKVSHSFIRREILALEKLGYEVERFALRTDPEELVDPLDQSELIKTRYLLKEKPDKILAAVFLALTTAPGLFLKGFKTAVTMGRRSERGLVMHLIYFIEACLLVRWQKFSAISHIHAHFGTNSTTVVMLAHLLGGAGYSFTVHGPEEFDKPEFIHLAEKIKHCRFVVAISSFGRSQLFRWIPATEWPKVKVVHCGLDTGFFENDYQPTPSQTRQLLCVGRLCEQKGQLLLLEALKILRDRGVNFNLIFAGDGPMRKQVEERIANYRLDSIEITGWISSERIKELLIASKGMVLPSFAEGLPVVIMETLALRRPVVSTYVAGIPELIRNGENGWLVPPSDVEALAAALHELLESPDATLQTMGENGFAKVFEHHHADKEAAKLAGYFETAREQ